MTPGNWYALTVKPQHEFRVAAALKTLETGSETFLPTYKDKRKWTDRVKIIDVPLFSGYVFARFTPEAVRSNILRTPGVRSFVEFAGEPAALDEREIAGIRTLVDSGFPLQPWPFLKAGQRVRVAKGPLRGVEGVIEGQKDAWRMIVSLELLQRSIAVTLDRTVLKTIGKVPPRRAGAKNHVEPSRRAS